MKASEVFKIASGRDAVGENRSMVRISTSFFDRESFESEEEDSVEMDNPIVEFHQNSRLTIVNLVFDHVDDDFIASADMLKRFQTIENSADEEKSPGISLTVMPKDLEGTFVYGVSGVALLQASRIGGETDTISFVFANDCIHAYIADLDAIDSDQLEEEVFLEEHFGVK